MKTWIFLSIIAFFFPFNRLLSEDNVFSFPEGGKIIFCKHKKGEPSYISDLEIKIQETNKSEPKVVWRSQKFTNPANSGLGVGLLYSTEVYTPKYSEVFYLFLTEITLTAEIRLKVIKIDINDNFKLTESAFIIYEQMAYLKMDSFAYGDDIIIKFSDLKNEEYRPNIYLFDTKSNNVFLLFSPQQLIYRNLPVELALLIKSPQGFFPKETLKVSPPRILDFVRTLETLPDRNPVRFSFLGYHYGYYLSIMAALEYKYLSEKVAPLSEDETKKQFENILKLPKSELFPIDQALLDSLEKNTPLTRQKLAFNQYIKTLDASIPSIPVTDEEIKSFYNNFLWAFRRSGDDPPYWSFESEHVVPFIKSEIQRLKYYGFDEFLKNPPKIDLTQIK